MDDSYYDIEEIDIDDIVTGMWIRHRAWEDWHQVTRHNYDTFWLTSDAIICAGQDYPYDRNSGIQFLVRYDHKKTTFKTGFARFIRRSDADRTKGAEKIETKAEGAAI